MQLLASTAHHLPNFSAGCVSYAARGKQCLARLLPGGGKKIKQRRKIQGCSRESGPRVLPCRSSPLGWQQEGCAAEGCCRCSVCSRWLHACGCWHRGELGPTQPPGWLPWVHPASCPTLCTNAGPPGQPQGWCRPALGCCFLGRRAFRCNIYVRLEILINCWSLGCFFLVRPCWRKKITESHKAGNLMQRHSLEYSLCQMDLQDCEQLGGNLEALISA